MTYASSSVVDAAVREAIRAVIATVVERERRVEFAEVASNRGGLVLCGRVDIAVAA